MSRHNNNHTQRRSSELIVIHPEGGGRVGIEGFFFIIDQNGYISVKCLVEFSHNSESIQNI